VFGLGKDSEYWSLLNKDGVTVFLENSAYWLDRITGRSKNIKAFKVRYDTKRSDWEMLIERSDLLDMPLPDEVRARKWDMILVDGPNGYEDHHPGRMKSIFLASELIGNPGDVFVHDCERIVENAYCNKFIGKEYLNKEISGKGGLLRHYRIFH
jgi:glucuronoxylan 4-O-methyltransferase